MSGVPAAGVEIRRDFVVRVGRAAGGMTDGELPSVSIHLDHWGAATGRSRDEISLVIAMPMQLIKIDHNFIIRAAGGMTNGDFPVIDLTSGSQTATGRQDQRHQ